MKKMIRFIATLLIAISIIGTIPVSAKEPNSLFTDDLEPYRVGEVGYYEYVTDEIGNTYRLAYGYANPLYNIMIDDYNVLTPDDLEEFKEGLRYLDDYDYYYTIKLKKVVYNQFKKACPDDYTNWAVKVTKKEKKFKKSTLDKNNKYYKNFTKMTKYIKKWYKNAKAEVTTYKTWYGIKAFYDYVIADYHKKGAWTYTFSYAINDAENRYNLIKEQKSSPYKKIVTAEDFLNNRASTGKILIKYAKDLGVIKNPDKKSPCKYCFADPYVDKYGTTHKYFTTVPYKNGEGFIVININCGRIETIGEGYGVTYDDAFEGMGAWVDNVNKAFKGVDIND